LHTHKALSNDEIETLLNCEIAEVGIQIKIKTKIKPDFVHYYFELFASELGRA